MRSSTVARGVTTSTNYVLPALTLALAMALAPPASFAAGGGAASPSSSGSGGGGGGAAQPQTPPIPLRMDLIGGCKAPGNDWTTADNLELSRLYNDGDWPHVQEKLNTFISKVTCEDSTVSKKKPARHTFPDGAPFSVVFLNEALEAPVLTRVLVQKPEPEVFGNRVAGFSLYDLQLFADSRLLVTSRYQASTGPNPLLAQVPSVVSQLSGGIGAALKPTGAVGGGRAVEAKAVQAKCAPGQCQTIYVVHLVHLPKPFKAWDSSVIPQVTVSDQLSSAVAVTYLLQSLADRSDTSPACRKAREDAQSVNAPGKIVGAVTMADGKTRVQGATVLVLAVGPAQPAACGGPVAKVNNSLRGAFLTGCSPPLLTSPVILTDLNGGFQKDQLDPGQYLVAASAPSTPGLGTNTELVTVEAGKTAPAILIPLPPASGPPDPAACAKALGAAIDDLMEIQALPPVQKAEAIAQVENLYATYLNLASPTQLTGPAPPTPYTLGRYTRFGFSLGAAVLGHPQLNTPAKVTTASATTTSTLLPDNPTTPLTFIAFDVHWPYDETRFSPSFAERLRAFFGVALTPDLGAVGGVGVGIVRGLSIEVGYSVLLAHALARGEQLSSPEVILHDPTPRKAVGAFFAGIGYSFQ
jgi:hypothetical protein